MSNNNYQDEIDLISVYTSIKKFFLNILQKFRELINFSIHNRRTLLFFIILGTGLGMAVFYFTKTIYVTDLTLSHKRLSNAQCQDVVNSLSRAANKDSRLAQELGIDIETARKIKSISYLQLNNPVGNDSLKMSDFKIEAKVYDTAILYNLQNKILHYLELNEYAKKRKEMNRIYLDKLEERIKKQIVSIDSLKEIVNKSIIPRSLGNGIILGESIDPVKVYQESMNLYQTQLKIDNDRELNNSFEIVVGFSNAVSTSRISTNILTGVIAGYFLGLLWLWKKNRR